MNWWSHYPYDWSMEHIYSQFKTVKEFEDMIPMDLKLSINKITLLESVHWIDYNLRFKCWPTSKQINIARGSTLKQERRYAAKDLVTEDNFGEHY